MELEEIYTKVREIINPVYLVGGCLRDRVLGIEPKDFDFTTPLDPDEVERRVKEAGKRAYLVGKRFGTIGFKIDGEMIEVTTFRHESYRDGKRKPEVIFIGDLTQDLMRRDFTFNAMAYRNGKLIDQFDGQEDLKNKVIRYVGNPNERIKDDPLRMLRCARFIARFNLKADGEIYVKTQKLSHKILNISKERVFDEMCKLLMTDNPSKGLDFLMHAGILRFIIPELSIQLNYNQNSAYHDLDLWEHTKRVVDSTPKDLALRWAALLHDIAKPFVRTNKEIFSLDTVTGEKKYKSNYINHDRLGAEIVEKTARYLKWPNDLREEVKSIVKTHLEDDNPLRSYDNAHKK